MATTFLKSISIEAQNPPNSKVAMDNVDKSGNSGEIRRLKRNKTYTPAVTKVEE